jgi:hypothetical protein
MADVIQFPKKPAPKVPTPEDHLHLTIESVVECLNIYKQAHPAASNTELFGSLMFLIVKNESRLNGVTAEQLLAAVRKHQAKGN